MRVVARQVWDHKVANKVIGPLVTTGEISQWFRMSPSWAYHHFIEDLTNGKWNEEWLSLDEFEKTKIEEMIETRDFSFYDEDRVIVIRRYSIDSEQETADYLVFTRNNDQVACITDDIPKGIYEKLMRAWPWKLSLRDFELIRDLTSIQLFGKNYIYPDERTHLDVRTIMERQAEMRYPLTVGEFAWVLGYDGYLRTHSVDALNRYKDELKQLTDAQNNICFSTAKDQLYSSMSQWANRRGGTLNQLISALGFTRIYKRENPYQDILLPFDRPTMEDDIEERLKRLESMQGLLDKTPGGNNRKNRCQQLVDELKKLYGNRCQMCGEENGVIPFIEKDNGDYYSEMHHIIPLSEVDNLADEWQFLDSYRNAIICCPLEWYHFS